MAPFHLSWSSPKSDSVRPKHQEKTGSGSLVLDGKKQYAIKHWFELTSKEAHEQVGISLRDSAFQYGPFGEQLSMYKFLFLESTQNLTAMTICDMQPVSNEPTITINWQLPLDGPTQGLLFKRIRIAFERATAIIDQPSDRKRYRMSEEDLLNLRNLICVWQQIKSFCSTRVKHFDELEAAISNGNGRDHELQAVLDARPQQFAVSMLSSAAKEAQEAQEAQETSVCMEVEKERVAVRDARWVYFQQALRRDQEKLRLAKDAPSKLESLKHRKQILWRLEQAKVGEKVIKSYRDKYLRTDLVSKPELAQQKVNEYRSFVVSRWILIF